MTTHLDFFLNNVQDSNLFTMNYPSREVTEQLWTDINTLQSISTSHFSFDYFTRDGQLLKELLESLQEFHDNAVTEKKQFHVSLLSWSRIKLSSYVLTDCSKVLKPKFATGSALEIYSQNLMTCKANSLLRTQLLGFLDHFLGDFNLSSNAAGNIRYNGPLDHALLLDLERVQQTVEISNNILSLFQKLQWS